MRKIGIISSSIAYNFIRNKQYLRGVIQLKPECVHKIWTVKDRDLILSAKIWGFLLPVQKNGRHWSVGRQKATAKTYSPMVLLTPSRIFGRLSLASGWVLSFSFDYVCNWRPALYNFAKKRFWCAVGDSESPIFAKKRRRKKLKNRTLSKKSCTTLTAAAPNFIDGFSDLFTFCKENTRSSQAPIFKFCQFFLAILFHCLNFWTFLKKNLYC